MSDQEILEAKQMLSHLSNWYLFPLPATMIALSHPEQVRIHYKSTPKPLKTELCVSEGQRSISANPASG